MINQLKQYLNPSLKTLVITNNDKLITKDLLETNNYLINISFMNIDTFIISILNSNHLNYEKSNILEKHHQLLLDNHPFKNSIAFLQDLVKLDKECFLSNSDLSINNEFKQYITFNKLDINNLNCLYDQIIILEPHTLLPLHKQVLNNLNIKPIYINNDVSINTNNITINTHDNYVELYNHLIEELISNSKSYLICVDDNLLKTNLISLLDSFNVSYTNLNTDNSLFYSKILNSIVNFILKTNDVYDLFNIFDYYKINLNSKQKQQIKYSYPNLDKIELDEKIVSFIEKINLINNSNDNKKIIENVYDLLIELDFINLDKLNNKTIDLYCLSYLNNLDLFVLINHYFNEISTCIKKENTTLNNRVFIGNTNHLGYYVDKVIIIDAAFISNTDYNTSLLLSLNDRLENNILTNNDFISIKDNQYKLLLNSCSDINIYHSLNSLDNKPNEIAYFIDDLNLKTIHHQINYFYSNKETNKNKVSYLNQDIIIKTLDYYNSISSSRLDAYNKCPYKYFVSYILRPKTLPNLAAKLGEIQHSVFELTKLEDFNFVYSDFIKNELDNLNEEMDLVNINILYDRLVNTIKSNLIILEEIINNTNFKPESFEQSFNYSYNDLNVTGKIDALLKYEDYHLVIDFKSSKHRFNNTDFEAGISNQLITYLYLLSKNNHQVIGAFYQNMKLGYVTLDSFNDDFEKALFNDKKLSGLLIDTPHINNNFDLNIINDLSYISNVKFEGRKGNDLVKDLEFLKESFNTLEIHMNNYLTNIKEGKYPIYPYNKSQCEYCDYHSVCKIDSNFNNYRKGDSTYE